MKISLRLLICLFTIASLVGCSGSKGTSETSASNKDTKSKTEALSKLSPEHRQSFDNWSKKVIKACNPSEAFGLLESEDLDSRGIDGNALLQKNNGSALFSLNGNFAILTSFNPFTGTGESKTEETQTTNGQNYTLSAEAKREGSHCEIYLYGQKVFETTIAQSFVVGAQWNSGKATITTSPIPQIKLLGNGAVSEVTQQGVFNLLSKSLTPTKDALTFFSKYLDINEEQTAKFFVLSSSSSAHSSLKIDNESSAVWSNEESGNLIAQSDVLKNAFDGTERTIPLEVRLEIPPLNLAGASNTEANGNLKLKINIGLSKKENNFNYSTQSINNEGIRAFDKNEAVECAKSRAMAYIGSSLRGNQLQPSVQVIFSPCRTLYHEIENESYTNGLMKSFIPQIFAGVTPYTQLQYGGWDEVLAKIVLEELNQGKDIRIELDPNATTQIIGFVSNYIQSLKEEINRSKNLEQSQSKNTIYQMGISWSLRGQSVSNNRMSQIVQAVDNSIDTFKVSSAQLLNDLTQKPDSYSDKLDFALTIDDTYKSEAINSLKLSKELNYLGFESDIFNKVIQNKTSVLDLKDWSSKLVTIKNEINKYPNISAVIGDLVSLSVKWTKAGEVASQDIGHIFAAINNSILPFDESTKKLIDSLSQSYTSNKDSLEFAFGITDEFKRLSQLVRQDAKTAGHENIGQEFFKNVLQKRPTLQQVKALSGLWKAIISFNSREQMRVKDESSSTNDSNRNKVIQNAINEIWSQADFEDLELIAEVARSKNTCAHYKGSSSLAECAGLNYFSKNKGKFLDPIYGRRYNAVAKDFVVYMNQLSGSEWMILRWSLVGEFFGSNGPIWSRCSQDIFNQRSTSLKELISSITRESDQLKKWNSEKQIKVTIQNCQN